MDTATDLGSVGAVRVVEAMKPRILGKTIRDKVSGFTCLVDDVFDASGYPGMLISWPFSASRRSSQAFTTKDFDKRWEVVP